MQIKNKKIIIIKINWIKNIKVYKERQILSTQSICCNGQSSNHIIHIIHIPYGFLINSSTKVVVIGKMGKPKQKNTQSCIHTLVQKFKFKPALSDSRLVSTGNEELWSKQTPPDLNLSVPLKSSFPLPSDNAHRHTWDWKNRELLYPSPGLTHTLTHGLCQV